MLLKVQSNIYQMQGWNKLKSEWFRSNSHVKMFNLGDRDIRESRAPQHVMYPYLVPWLEVRRECALFLELS